MMEWIENAAFEILGISNDQQSGENESIEVGEYQVSDCPYLVYDVSNAVIQALEEKRRLVQRFAPSQANRLPYVKTPETFFSEYAPKTQTLPPELPTDTRSIKAYISYVEQSFPSLSSFFFTRLKFRIPEEARRKHTYILGGSGSGKSELLKVLMYPYIRQNPRKTTVILFDPHGDIAQQVGRWKEHSSGENLILFDPSLRSGYMPCINPLEVPANTPPEMIENMAECLTAVFREIVGAESTITANMGTILKAVIAVLLQRPDSTLKDLQRFMRDEENEDLVNYAIKHSPAGKRHLFEHGFYDKSYTPTKKALYTKLQDLFNSQTFYDLTVGKSTLNLKEMMDSRKTIIFSLPKGKIGEQTSSAFGRFLLAQIQGFSFQRQSIPEKERVPTHIFLDEFHNFVTPSIEDILAESRKYAVHLTLVQQFFGQKTDTQLRAGIMNNTAIKICGTGEDASLEKMARVMTGVTKEELQNCDRGVFYVKVKRQGGILQQAFGTNHARPLRNNISLLGFRNGMGKGKWKKVQQQQIEKYYRSLKPKISQSEKEMFTPSTAEKKKKPSLTDSLLGLWKGRKKKSVEQTIEQQKTPEWLQKHIKETEGEHQTAQNAPESKNKPQRIQNYPETKKTNTAPPEKPEQKTQEIEPPVSTPAPKPKTEEVSAEPQPTKPKDTEQPFKPKYPL